MEVISIDKLNKDDAKLMRAAQKAAAHTYAPYSNFGVGAALITKSGNVFTGSNSENAAFTGVHAEFAACAAAVSGGDTEIVAIAVSPATKRSPGSDLITPCGNCRQHIFEFAQKHNTDIQILCGSFDRKTVGITSISELLPFPFGPHEVLGK